MATGMFPQRLKDAGRCSVADSAAVPAKPPLHPHERYAEYDKTDKIGDHKSAAAVLGGLHGESQEITETDGVSAHGEDQPDP